MGWRCLAVEEVQVGECLSLAMAELNEGLRGCGWHHAGRQHDSVDSQFDGTSKEGSVRTDSELAALTASARELGRSTLYTASQAAEGMQYLAMAGFDVNETIAAMPGMLNLALAGGTDLGRTADIASNILSGFQIPAA